MTDEKMAYDRLEEVKDIAEAMRALAERMVAELGDLPYNRVGEIIDEAYDLSHRLDSEAYALKKERDEQSIELDKS